MGDYGGWVVIQMVRGDNGDWVVIKVVGKWLGGD